MEDAKLFLEEILFGTKIRTSLIVFLFWFLCMCFYVCVCVEIRGSEKLERSDTIKLQKKTELNLISQTWNFFDDI